MALLSAPSSAAQSRRLNHSSPICLGSAAEPLSEFIRQPWLLCGTGGKRSCKKKAPLKSQLRSRQKRDAAIKKNDTGPRCSVSLSPRRGASFSAEGRRVWVEAHIYPLRTLEWRYVFRHLHLSPAVPPSPAQWVAIDRMTLPSTHHHSQTTGPAKQSSPPRAYRKLPFLTQNTCTSFTIAFQ